MAISPQRNEIKLEDEIHTPQNVKDHDPSVGNVISDDSPSQQSAFNHGVIMMYAMIACMFAVIFLTGFKFYGFYLDNYILGLLITSIISSLTVLFFKKILQFALQVPQGRS